MEPASWSRRIRDDAEVPGETTRSTDDAPRMRRRSPTPDSERTVCSLWRPRRWADEVAVCWRRTSEAPDEPLERRSACRARVAPRRREEGVCSRLTEEVTLSPDEVRPVDVGREDSCEATEARRPPCVRLSGEVDGAEPGMREEELVVTREPDAEAPTSCEEEARSTGGASWPGRVVEAPVGITPSAPWEPTWGEVPCVPAGTPG